MKNPKATLIAILLVLIVIVTLQNTETVDTKVLFMTLSMPRALLLFITLAVGVVIGLLAGNRSRRAAE